MKMERKEKNKHKSQRADNLPAPERFSIPGKYMASNLNNVVPDVNEPQALKLRTICLFDVK